MKKQFLIAILIIALCITSAGCGKQITDNPEKKPVETVVATEPENVNNTESGVL